MTKKEVKRFCKGCGKKLEKKKGQKRINPKRKFCNTKCQTRYNSKKRYERLKDNEEYKKYHKEYFKEWRKENKEQHNNLMLKNYRQNKKKWNSRINTRRILKGNDTYKKRELFPEECKNCGSKENLGIHHEVYPTTIKGIVKASNEGKIYYLCKKCHAEEKK